MTPVAAALRARLCAPGFARLLGFGRGRISARALGVAVLALCFVLAPVGRPAAAQPLVADLSDHLIAITTAFTGADAVMFGAVEEPGHIAITVTGPPRSMTVREAQRTAGVWMNRDEQSFQGVPAFYAVATSAPLASLAPETVLDRHGIGATHVRLAPAGLPPEAERDPAVAERLDRFRAALIRQMADAGTWQEQPGTVSFLANRLFRARMEFPANVPVGQYTVSVYLIRDGAVVSAQTTPLYVNKTGASAWISTVARDYAAVYGIAAILIAVAAGWLAGVAFRRN